MSPSLFPQSIETERLRFDPLHEAVDVLDLYEYHRSGELDAVMQSLGETPHATPKETSDALAESRETWESSERATYAITHRERSEFIGVAELWLEWKRRRASFGIWIREEWWGEGYSTERAGAFLVVAFEALDLEVVTVGHEPDNDRSKRSIKRYVERYGGRYDGRFRNHLPPGDEGGPRDLCVYSISQSEWRANHTAEERASIRIERASDDGA